MHDYHRRSWMFKDELKEAFLERFEGIVDEDGELVEDYEQPQYWQDDISELADSAVPIYTNDLYDLWMGLGRPDVDDHGLIEGVTDIDQIVRVAIYEYATQYLYELAQEYGLE